MLRIAIGVAALSTALLSGCVTTQGGGMTNSLLKPLGIDASNISDTFSSQMRDVKRLVDEGKMTAAEALLITERQYFTQRLADTTQPLPEQLQKLGTHIWAKDYAQPVARALQGLAGITDVSRRELWPEQTQALKTADSLAGVLESDATLRLLRLGTRERTALREGISRVQTLAEAGRARALPTTFEGLLATGTHDPTYVGRTFFIQDYLNSPDFQVMAQTQLLAQTDKAGLQAMAQKLSAYLTKESKSAVDQRFAGLVVQELKADGQVTLQEMASTSGMKTPFGGAADALAGLVKVGYVDLTSASFKDRNIFDFQIAFKKDLALSLDSANESVFQSANWGGYDYLFVTDLAVAKVSREFKSKTPVKSRARTGERREPNPNYVTAMSNYQQAMAEYQREQINAAVPKACSGWGCVLQGIASGLSQSAAKDKVDAASRALAGTSQTVSIPVYEDYDYQSVDISATKTADVNYYVIDVKGRRILRSNFQVNDQERFNVAYNVRDEDPQKSSILGGTKSEEAVTAWEKQPVEVPLSALFSETNLKTATSAPLTDVPTFLASLVSRNVVAAAPTYTPSMGDGRQLSSLRDSATSTAQTIADERFDSIVVVQGPSSIGTGFYVTPELVLTAHHVVDKSALVQMTFYDGTKTFGKVVAHDILLDLALIRAQTTGKPLKIHQGPLRLGETVEAIGHPKGYEFTITRGVISAVRKQRSSNIGSGNLVEFVQTDTPISPGNSGGPLLLGGSVIGVNDWIRVDKGAQNLNFSVSFNEIRSFLDRYKGQ